MFARGAGVFPSAAARFQAAARIHTELHPLLFFRSSFLAKTPLESGREAVRPRAALLLAVFALYFSSQSYKVLIATMSLARSLEEFQLLLTAGARCEREAANGGASPPVPYVPEM